MRRGSAARLLLSCLAGVCVACSPSPPSDVAPTPSAAVRERPDLARFFDAFDAEGTIVVLDGRTGERAVYNPRRAAEGFLPASTFKIFNSMAALETGVVAPDETIRWDGVERRVPVWNQDQRMREAFQRSVVWFYQELARRIGPERMRALLEREGYGNRDIGGGIDRFWLTGDLRISANEQVGFLRRMRERELGFDDDVVATVEELMVLERCASYTLRAKTGWVEPGGKPLGWLVGWVERVGHPYYYALNLESDDPDFPMMRARSEILRGVLRELAVLPERCD